MNPQKLGCADLRNGWPFSLLNDEQMSNKGGGG